MTIYQSEIPAAQELTRRLRVEYRHGTPTVVDKPEALRWWPTLEALDAIADSSTLEATAVALSLRGPRWGRWVAK